MKGDLKMEAYDLEPRETSSLGEVANMKGGQGGSMILEAIIVLGMVATFTPLLYKHVADRRADIENINRANTLIYLQQKTEEYLKDPDNITDLVNELGHNQHKEIFPSELGIGDNFDGRYIIGIRREDEQNKPVLKAMIIDTVNTGSDLRAAKVAELIGISAGIYTAVDPDAAWGINGMWSEPLSRYFTTTDIPTGAVAVTTEYNKEKYRVSMSDILVDSDLDMGEFELTAEQINAINLAAQTGTIDQLTATDVRASNKVVAGTKLCVGGEADENCIESWEGLGGGDNALTEYQLIINCNMGDESSCQIAYVNNLNRTCSSIKDIFTRAGFGNSEGATPVYSLTYGTGNTYEGYVRTQCGGTQFVVDNISTPNLSNPVEQVGGSAFAITQPGWYQITLMGEAGYWSSGKASAGGILIANTYYDADTLIALKGIKGGLSSIGRAGAGVALWDTVNTTGVPTLVAGGGQGGSSTGGGYVGGGGQANGIGYGWNGTQGGNTTSCCTTASGCNNGATGGGWIAPNDANVYQYGGTGTGSSGYPCPSGYTCNTVTGGNMQYSGQRCYNYSSENYGNWITNTLTGGKGYASIRWCGPSGSASSCPDTCSSESDCSDPSFPYCSNGICSAICISDSQCSGDTPYCTNGACEATKSCTADSQCSDSAPYCNGGICSSTRVCTSNSDCTFASEPYCFSNQCSNVLYSLSGGTTLFAANAGKYKFELGGSLNGGTWTATKTLRSYTSFKAITISGGSNSCATCSQGTGVGLLEEGVIKLVAGGGGTGRAGGGYVGGWGMWYYNGDPSKINTSAAMWGSSWDGTKTSYSTATSGAGGGARSRGAYSSNTHWAWGGTGYCASDYSCTGTYGTNAGGAYITVTYCGPDANSTCP